MQKKDMLMIYMIYIMIALREIKAFKKKNALIEIQ